MEHANAALIHARYALLRDAIVRPCLRKVSVNCLELVCSGFSTVAIGYYMLIHINVLNLG